MRRTEHPIPLPPTTPVPNKLKASWWAMTLRQEDAGVIKYEVRSTKYEVKELGATELRGGVGRRQDRGTEDVVRDGAV